MFSIVRFQILSKLHSVLSPPSTFKTYSSVSHLFHSSRLSHQHAATHLTLPLLPIQWQHLQRERVTTQILVAFRFKSADNAESTLTLLFAPSYRLTTDLTKTSGISFSSNTLRCFLVLCQSLSPDVQYSYTAFSFSVMLFLPNFSWQTQQYSIIQYLYARKTDES